MHTQTSTRVDTVAVWEALDGAKLLLDCSTRTHTHTNTLVKMSHSDTLLTTGGGEQKSGPVLVCVPLNGQC